MPLQAGAAFLLLSCLPPSRHLLSIKFLLLEVHASDKRYGKHHNHRGKAHISQFTTFAFNTGFNKNDEHKRNDGGDASHRMEHFHFFFVRKFSIRAINKVH